MTCSRQRRLTPILRICAAVTLVFWLAALDLCSTECLIEHSDSHQMEQAADTNDHRDSDKNGHDDDSFCASLQFFAPTFTDDLLVKPDRGLIFTLNFVSPAPLVSTAEAEAPISRQPPNHEWRFTPEVCLGPALRSHAPPPVC